jgi:hypothetical protein
MKKKMILLLINKELKSGLLYCLQTVNHKAWFYTYEENYTKQELREALINELLPDGKIDLSKINKLDPFRKAVESVNEILENVIHNPEQTFMITKGFNCCDDLRPATPEQIEIIKLKFPFKFRLFDDDDILYYEGYSVDDSSFDPLDDFGTPNAGATYIKYFEKGRFNTL